MTKTHPKTAEKKFTTTCRACGHVCQIGVDFPAPTGLTVLHCARTNKPALSVCAHFDETKSEGEAENEH